MATSTITPVSSSDDTDTMTGGKKSFYTVDDIPTLAETLKSVSSSEQQQEEARAIIKKWCSRAVALEGGF